MKRKVGIILAICLIVAFIIGKCSEKPRIVSSITTMDTAYITVLVPKWDTYNVEQLKEKLIQMCLEDEFSEIKLRTEDKPAAESFHISVYTSAKNLDEGKEFLYFKCENMAPVM